MPYPKRLIEVDLPIRQISAHARREKSIRHGHISTLHIWWARRPLAACRAVICAALWPDPADDLCPQAFRDAAPVILCAFAEKVRSDKQLAGLCAGHWQRWSRTTPGSMKGSDPVCWPDMRYALLDFIADFANWDASTVPAFLETARALTQAAHEALGGAPGTRPLVVDPFAGGGSIPLEALRVGADAFASDLNPVAVLLNKVVLEYIPTYGQQLADEVRTWGQWIKEQAEKELADFYPKDPDGATPIAYLWARTITCEGPGCGAEVPLIHSLWLSKAGKSRITLAVRGNVREKRVELQVAATDNTRQSHDGTVRNGSATCPVCGYTTPNDHVRTQLASKNGGANVSRLIGVVTTRSEEQGRRFRLPTERDHAAIRIAQSRIAAPELAALAPCEQIEEKRPSPNARGLSAVTRMGVTRFCDLFTARQLLLLITLSRLTNEVGARVRASHSAEFATAVQTCLALAVDRQADHSNSCCAWNPSGPKLQHLFSRQAAPIVWDFAEAQPFGDSVGDWLHAVDCVLIALDNASHSAARGRANAFSATTHPFPDDAADALITDPPYYDSVPYADLSDFFYVWLKRSLEHKHPELLSSMLTPKDEEAIWNPSRIYPRTGKSKDESFYETQMTTALAEARRITMPSGIGVVVFAHKSTAGWEAILSALIDAGWTATASWPLDTEMGTRLNAIGTASLASSIHVVCRTRENPDGSLQTNSIGDWRDVLAELPGRIHDWMPRLAAEGVVGADAIFACLGPALEIFSRYARVEKASGEQVTLKEYLEYVWAAVSKEALAMIFAGADATGFEEDARLTAMWLWTLGTSAESRVPSAEAKVPPALGTPGSAGSEEGEGDDEDEGTPGKKALVSGYVLEYDAARKIAQGLGAHLERLTNLVEVRGDKARLLPVADRAPYLLGKEDDNAGRPVLSAEARRKLAQADQLALFGDDVLEAVSTTPPSAPSTPHSELALGKTTLDRIHQSMLLFAAGRGDALKAFLLQGDVGHEQRFWRLAQALSALYPASSDEKRWVDGVLARKKGLGL